MPRTPRFEDLSPWAAAAIRRAEPLGRHEPDVGRTTQVPTTNARLSKEIDTNGSLPAQYNKETAQAFLKRLRDPTGIGSRGSDVPWSSIGDITDALGRGKWPDSGDVFDWLKSIKGRIEWMEKYFGGPPKGDGVAMESSRRPPPTQVPVAGRGFFESVRQAIVEKVAADAAQKTIGANAKKALKILGLDQTSEDLNKAIFWEDLKKQTQKKTSGRHIELIKWGNKKWGQAEVAKVWKDVRKGRVSLEPLDMSKRQQMAGVLQRQKWADPSPEHSDVGSQDVFRVKMKMREMEAMRWDLIQRIFWLGTIDPRPD